MFCMMLVPILSGLQQHLELCMGVSKRQKFPSINCLPSKLMADYMSDVDGAGRIFRL
jgi:hypothetical protein